MADGLLLVLSDPGAVPEAEFHDWYDGEHVPARMALDGIHTGLRLRAGDDARPPWAAAYDIDLAALATPAYRALRDERSPREQELMARLATLDRRVYETLGEHRSRPGEGTLWIFTSLTAAPGEEDTLDDWYVQEHVPLLHAIDGWLRTRRYALLEGDAPRRLALHELRDAGPLSTPAYRAATSTPWRADVMAGVTARERRVFEPWRRFC